MQMKNIILVSIALSLLCGLFAQGKPSSDIDQWLYEQQPADQAAKKDSVLTNDLITVNYGKKDARLAMLMSLIVQVSGQVYAHKSSITTYIFSVIELACIGGLVYFNLQGNDKTDKFEKYATGEKITYTTTDGTLIEGYRYQRDRQNVVQEILKGINSSDIYDNGYFRLDPTDTQHFYEDIGKYPHYVFGWMDWYYRFAADASGGFADPRWVVDGPLDNPNTHWTGNFPQWGNDTAVSVSPNSHDASMMRKAYIEMRNDAKSEYSKAHIFTMVLALNHIAAGVDAIRVTRKVNRLSISQAKPQMNIYAAMIDGAVTPMMGMKWQF